MPQVFRMALVLMLVVAVPWLPGTVSAQGQGHDHEAHHRDMLTRGAQAMGFDQDRTDHHFLLYADGGAIDVAVKELGDIANLEAVRQHLREIAGLFKAGDFGKPALTHALQVPGTADMTRLKDRITYRYEETAAGGRVRIVTRDAAALAAVHAFLRFQIEDHRTADSTDVQRSDARHMMNRVGPGTMGSGRDVAAMAEMGDIHELFINHDRITRTVTNLPDGIRTVTESTDPRIAQVLRDHVTTMGQRVDAGSDPGLPIESEALRAIYRNHDKIHTTFEPTANGIVVLQTSTDHATVAALQQHAAEVTDFVNGGMAAAHAAMMRNGGMPGGMHGHMMDTSPQGTPTPAPK